MRTTVQEGQTASQTPGAASKRQHNTTTTEKGEMFTLVSDRARAITKSGGLIGNNRPKSGLLGRCAPHDVRPARGMVGGRTSSSSGRHDPGKTLPQLQVTHNPFKSQAASCSETTKGPHPAPCSTRNARRTACPNTFSSFQKNKERKLRAITRP